MVNTALIVPPDEWEEVKKSLAEIKSRLAENSAEEFSNEILTSEEARKILGIVHVRGNCTETNILLTLAK